jgi:hypothetical protein
MDFERWCARMKRILIWIVLALFIVFLVGCAEIVSEKPIDTEYIAAYDAMETVYGYKYDWFHGDFKYLPEIKQVHHEEEYKVQYERVWSDGSTDIYWLTVSKEEYENALRQIKEGGAE